MAFAIACLAVIGAVSCKGRSTGGQQSILSIAEQRGLTPDDAVRAVKTFVPPGSHDEYMLFASGGHSGQLHVIGVPSMRLLRNMPLMPSNPALKGTDLAAVVAYTRSLSAHEAAER